MYAYTQGILSSLFMILLHTLFTLAAGIGLIILVATVIKFGDQKTLHSYAKWLLIVGIIGALVTGAIAMKQGKKWHRDGKGGYHKMMHKDDMMDQDQDGTMENENTTENSDSDTEGSITGEIEASL